MAIFPHFLSILRVDAPNHSPTQAKEFREIFYFAEGLENDLEGWANQIDTLAQNRQGQAKR